MFWCILLQFFFNFYFIPRYEVKFVSFSVISFSIHELNKQMENRRQRVTKNLFVKMVYMAVQLKLHLIIRRTFRKCKYLMQFWIEEKRKRKISSRFALFVLGRTRERRGVDATPIKFFPSCEKSMLKLSEAYVYSSWLQIEWPLYVSLYLRGLVG